MRIHKTRFDRLGYANVCPGIWQFIDLIEPCAPAQIGRLYATKAELLADLERFAQERGFAEPSFPARQTQQAPSICERGMIIRDAPELHAALLQLDRQMVRVPAANDQGLTRWYWVPCCGCKNVVARPREVVSTVCVDCLAPCSHPDCGLLRHEHRDGCEPRV